MSYAWAGFGAAFGPVVLFSVMWSRMTRNGALAGMIIGALTVIVWKQFGWLGLYEIIPGFIFGSIGIVVFSLLGKAPSAAMQKRFAEANSALSFGSAVTVAGKLRDLACGGFVWLRAAGCAPLMCLAI